jgi:formate dehydrogenase iron-sulfur subunit
MQFSRRDFVKRLGVGVVGGFLFSSANVIKASAATSDGTEAASAKAMLYDSSKCVGCRACQNACRRWNELPPESIGYGGIYDNPSDLSAKTWTIIKAKEYDNNGSQDLIFCKYQCMHCTEAACVDVCPSGALQHHPLGFVSYDEEKCIGCGYCMEHCPFHVPHLSGNMVTGVQKMHKCTFCQDRVPEGQQTACAEACPAGALIFGDREELITEGERRVDEIQSDYPQAKLYGKEELGGLHALYILKDTPEVYRLPEDPQIPVTAMINKDILGPIARIVWPLVAAAFALNFVVAWFRQRKHGEVH